MLNVTVCTEFFFINANASMKGTMNFFLKSKRLGGGMIKVIPGVLYSNKNVSAHVQLSSKSRKST